MTRNAKMTAFIAEAGWGAAQIFHLAGDASNRVYFRLVKHDGNRAVLMDAPPEKGEDVRPFVSIAQYLNGIGLSAPLILHQNRTDGFLLIEDLGDRLFEREVAADPTVQIPLYRAAADVLTQLHSSTPPDLAPYASATTVPLAAMAFDWYQFGAAGAMNENAKSAFCEIFLTIVSAYDRELNVLIQRDYHAENLIWLPDRTGLQRVGLLDFQSAALGHVTYDLVSVLQDARRDVPSDIEREIKTYFIEKNGHNPIEFDAAYAVFGVQRNLRILGVFARLCLRDGKAGYVDLMLRVWGHVLTNLRHPILADIAPLILKNLPAPSQDVCAKLKEGCGQWSGR